MMRIRLKIKENLGPEGYFTPSYTSKGKLLLIPGIVDFEDKDELISNVLILNLTNKAIKIKADTKVGETQVLTDDDVTRTELIELTNKSLTDIRVLKKKEKITKPENKTPKEINFKVSMSYSNTIPGVTHKKGSATPSQFEKIITENPTKEFLEGYLHGAQDNPDNPGVRELDLRIFYFFRNLKKKKNVQKHFFGNSFVLSPILYILYCCVFFLF